LKNQDFPIVFLRYWTTDTVILPKSSSNKEDAVLYLRRGFVRIREEKNKGGQMGQFGTTYATSNKPRWPPWVDSTWDLAASPLLLLHLEA